MFDCNIICCSIYSIKFKFYRVDRALNIDDIRSKIDEKTKAIYIIHYFGFPQRKEIIDELINIREEKNIELIEDITQTLFSRDKGCMGFGDYILCSIRKWFSITDGGLLAV